MADEDKGSNRGIPEQSDALSATGMFLRAFESGPQAPVDSQAAAPPPVHSAESFPRKASEGSSGPEPAETDLTSSQPGEFTRLFQAARGESGAPPARAESGVREQIPQAPSVTPEAGEFTRIFVSGSSAAAGSAVPPVDESRRAVSSSPVSPGRAKGFSAPGLSDSVSGGASFTQFLKSAASTPPAQPVSDISSQPTRIVELPNGRDFSKQSQKSPAPESSPSSVTSLISSLSSQGSGRAGSGFAENVPYNLEQASSFPPMPAQRADRPIDPGGVTGLIQKLAQEQVTGSPAPPPPSFASVPPANSEPGEFTKMISRLSSSESPSAAAPLTPNPAPSPAAGAPAPFQAVAPALKTPLPPAPAVPKVAVPPVAAAPIPQPAPALPKSTLESLVPILLLVDTALLLLVLVVLLFKGR